MSRRTTLTTEAQQTVLAANIISTGLHAALANIDTALAGWPTSTPGAAPLESAPTAPCRNVDCTHIRPCPLHDDEPVRLTTVEQNASQHDRARSDSDELARCLRQASRLLARASGIVTFWAYNGLTQTEIKTRLLAIDASIWCENCVRYGRHETRRKGAKRCDFCDDFYRDHNKRECPKEIWDARDARGGRIDITTTQRILKRLADEAKAAKEAEKQARKLARTKSKGDAA